MERLNDRKRTILRAVIREYIQSSEPVSSRVIAAKCALALSPASIRKDMAELEDLGYLLKPHTSAGRVPARMSFRYYLESLLKVEEPLTMDKERIRSLFLNATNAKEWVLGATKALSGLTHHAVMATATRSNRFIIKHIGVMRIDSVSVMVVIVGENNTVYNKLVHMKPLEVERVDFERVSNYLNDISSGLSIAELKQKIIREMQNEKRLCDEMLANALKLSAAALADADGAPEAESIYHVEGQANIIDQPEFRVDLDKMKRIFSVFEEKGLLVKILDECMSKRGVKVFLGSESHIDELSGLGFVATPYSMDGGFEGTLGVIGPLWMDYPKIIPLLGFTAALFAQEAG